MADCGLVIGHVQHLQVLYQVRLRESPRTWMLTSFQLHSAQLMLRIRKSSPCSKAIPTSFRPISQLSNLLIPISIIQTLKSRIFSLA